MKSWEKKAHRVIAQYCRESWEQNGRWPGYYVPSIAHALVQALGIHNDDEREREVKRLFEVERLGAWTLI